MQMISRKAKYGIRALLALSRRNTTTPVLIAALAKEEKISKKFLELILLELKHKGILKSKKGRGEGYLLNRSPEEISLGEIIRVLEGSLALSPCASQAAHRKCDECGDEATCGIRSVLKDVRDATAMILDQESLADVLRRVEALRQAKSGVLAYSI